MDILELLELSKQMEDSGEFGWMKEMESLIPKNVKTEMYEGVIEQLTTLANNQKIEIEDKTETIDEVKGASAMLNAILKSEREIQKDDIKNLENELVIRDKHIENLKNIIKAHEANLIDGLYKSIFGRF